jgi:acetoin:2,6-dichlorophenolindophenol oxidoreductase subunit beta
MDRILKFHEALREAADICLERDPNVYLMGLGVPDPKGIFGTTTGLQEKYGEKRVLDMPVSENGMTGVALGSALVGMRPILTHQRLDFALLTMEQIVNQAAKWHYVFGGQTKVPMVIRLILGRGWGQGPQHSQSLHSWFAHIPGLKVVMPATPADAKGLFIASVEDNNPVIFIDHRWSHNITGNVPKGHYTVPIGPARVAREGRDVTIVAASYMTLEALRAAELLHADSIEAEVIDLRTIAPLDSETILKSVARTGRLVIADLGSKSFGIGGEIIARVVEKDPTMLKSAPARVCVPDFPTPTTPALANNYYPRAAHIAAAVRRQLGLPVNEAELISDQSTFNDVPDKTFTGPF